MPAISTEFRPIPHALCERIHEHVFALEDASSTDAQIAALFLAHAELKDAEAMLPEIETLKPPQRNSP